MGPEKMYDSLVWMVSLRDEEGKVSAVAAEDTRTMVQTARSGLSGGHAKQQLRGSAVTSQHRHALKPTGRSRVLVAQAKSDVQVGLSADIGRSRSTPSSSPPTEGDAFVPSHKRRRAKKIK